MEQKVEKKKYGVVVKDSDQIGQLSKFCLIDFFFSVFHFFWGLSVALGRELCSYEFYRGGENKKAVKRLLSSTNVS